jgi:hypothetical protein
MVGVDVDNHDPFSLGDPTRSTPSLVWRLRGDAHVWLLLVLGSWSRGRENTPVSQRFDDELGANSAALRLDYLFGHRQH